MTQQTSRRRFLTAAAVTGTLAGLNATILASGHENHNVILLGGKVEGWQGYRLPEQPEANGATNPTLTLEPGTTYTLLWKNLDGVPHTFAIKDAQGNNLKVLQPITVQADRFEQLNQTAQNQTTTAAATQTTTAVETQTTTAAEQVAVTETLSEQGAVQGVKFTASEKMAQYICTVHPNTMVGSIQLSDGSGSQNNSSM